MGGSSNEQLSATQQTSDGGYILAGISESGISGDKSQANKGICDFNPNCTGDYWVVRVDEFGNKLWDKTFGGSGNDELRVVRQTADGGYILAGWSESGAGGDKTDANAGFWILKLDAAGNKELDETFSKGDLLTSLQPTSDGGFIIGGRSSFGIVDDKTEANRGGHDYWVVKLAPIPAPGQLVSFTLINADNEQPIKVISPGEVLNLATLPTRNLNIRADTDPATVGSVNFGLTGPYRRNKWDNVAPYALYGDDGGNYNKWIPLVGTYNLTATPYSGADKQGTAGTPMTISFTVIDQPATAARLAQAPSPEESRQGVLYPNPTADGRLQVQLSQAVQGSIRYTLVSAVGQTLTAGAVYLENPTNQLAFDFSRQLTTAGLYYLRLEGNQVYQVLKVMSR